MNNNTYIVGARKPDGIEPTISQERLEEIKGFASKYKPQAVVDISTIHPEDGDIIVITVDMEKADIELTATIHSGIQDCFSNNKVVIIPKSCQLKIYNNKDFIKVLRKLLEELEND